MNTERTIKLLAFVQILANAQDTRREIHMAANDGYTWASDAADLLAAVKNEPDDSEALGMCGLCVNAGCQCDAFDSCAECGSFEGCYVPPGSGDAYCLHCGADWPVTVDEDEHA